MRKLRITLLTGLILCAAAQIASADNYLCATYSSNCTNFNTATTTQGTQNITVGSLNINVNGIILDWTGSADNGSATIGSLLSSQVTLTGAHVNQSNFTDAGSTVNTNLGFKNTPGDASETGLGFTSDPLSGENEIFYLNTATNQNALALVQIGVGPLSGKAGDVYLQVGSAQQGEGFQIWGSNTAVTNLSSAGNLVLLQSAAPNNPSNGLTTVDLNAVAGGVGFSKYAYYYVSSDRYSGSSTETNVVLSAAAFVPTATPEPTSIVLFGTALAGLAVARRRRA